MNFPLSLPAKPIILASASPRRKELLQKIGLDFQVRPSDIEENGESHLSPPDLVKELALRKARAIAKDSDDAIVIGADTMVVVDNEILGKPGSPTEACQMLERLSGRTHQVYTGFAIVDAASGRSVAHVEKTEVTFRQLERDEIETYVSGGGALDKAGAYGIQDFSAIFAESIHGCFYNVVGFPISRFYVVFRDFLTNHAGKADD